MKPWHVGLILVLTVAAAAGCGSGPATPAPADAEGSETYTGAVLDTSYPDALPANSQLVLGTLLLEETEHALTPQQAAALLPLWQAIQGGTLQGSAETNTVLKQIEGAMTPEQLAAIAAMRLTQDDWRTWAQSQGVSLGLSPEERATRQAERGDQATVPGMPPGSGQGGGRGDFGPGSGLSPEEIETLRATAEASGGKVGAGRAGAGQQQSTFLLQPLIEMLTQRAAE